MFCKQTIEREGVFLSSVSSLVCVCVCGASLQQRMQGKTGSRFRSLSLSLSLSFLCSPPPLLSLFWCVPTTIMYLSLSLYFVMLFSFVLSFIQLSCTRTIYYLSCFVFAMRSSSSSSIYRDKTHNDKQWRYDSLV